MGGDQATNGIQLLVIDGFQCLGYSPVEHPSPQRADLAVGDFAQQRMTEVVFAGALFAQYMMLP